MFNIIIITIIATVSIIIIVIITITDCTITPMLIHFPFHHSTAAGHSAKLGQPGAFGFFTGPYVSVLRALLPICASTYRDSQPKLLPPSWDPPAARLHKPLPVVLLPQAREEHRRQHDALRPRRKR